MYRMIDCATWDDPWFSELKPDAKLLFLNLFTNRRTTPSGVFEVSTKIIAVETGLAVKRIEELLASGFGGKVVWWPDLHAIWVRNFYRRQKANDKFRIGAMRSITAFPPEVRDAVCAEYPELQDEKDTHPIPIPYPSQTPTQTPDTHGKQRTDTDTDQDQVRDQDQIREEFAADGGETKPIPTPPKPGRVSSLDGFEEWYRLYPRRVKPADAERAWAKIKPDDRRLAVDAIRVQVHWPAMTGDPQYIPYPASWLNGRQWADEPPRTNTNGRHPPKDLNAEAFDAVRREMGIAPRHPTANEPNEIIDVTGRTR